MSFFTENQSANNIKSPLVLKKKLYLADSY